MCFSCGYHQFRMMRCCCSRPKLLLILTVCMNAVFWWNYSNMEWEITANMDGLPLIHNMRSNQANEDPTSLEVGESKLGPERVENVKAKDASGDDKPERTENVKVKDASGDDEPERAENVKVKDASGDDEPELLENEDNVEKDDLPQPDARANESAEGDDSRPKEDVRVLEFMQDLAKDKSLKSLTGQGQGKVEKENIRRENYVPDFDAQKLKMEGNTVRTDPRLQHDKWIVVTSVVSPTSDVKFLANISSWRVVVVGDTKTPADWSYPNCHFLSVSDQEKLGFHITSRLPYRSYARKNIGYLFAIAHGAKVIYETDDDNRPLDRLSSFRLEPTMSGLMFAGVQLFNPYRHFGQSTLWPRGYPLGEVGTASNVSYRVHDKWESPAIQQGVVNGDPDMDAIFRLTRKQTLSRLEVTFDPAAPPVILPEGVFSPFNSQNTLFLHNALWAMLLPTTTTFRMCDIWRGFWAQRLLWEIGGRLAFFPPNAYQQRNAHSYMADASDEKEMYFHTERLLEFLAHWTCPQKFSFFQCVYKLSADMADEDFWEEGDVHVTKLWLEDLLRVSYPEPQRVEIPTDKYNLVSKLDFDGFQTLRNQLTKISDTVKTDKSKDFKVSELDVKWLLTVHNGTYVKFIASEQSPPAVYIDRTKTESIVGRHANQIASLCPELPVMTMQTATMSENRHSYFQDVLLVIVFNWPYYKNVRYLEILYRPFFPNIAYCGGNATQFSEDTNSLNSEFTFIEASVTGGIHGYSCIISAMTMGYNVSGYMVVSDDALINLWNFHKFDKTRLWTNYLVNMFDSKAGTDWMWWPSQWGAHTFNTSMLSLKRPVKVPQNVKKPSDFLATLYNNTGDPQIGIHSTCDVYYIPSRLKDSALFYLSHFRKHDVFLEMAVTLTFYGLESREEIQFFGPTNLWVESRLNPWTFWTADNYFIHPVKFSNDSNRAPLCSHYLTNLLLKGHAADGNSANTGQTQLQLQLEQAQYRQTQDLHKQDVKKKIEMSRVQLPQQQPLQHPLHQAQQNPLHQAPQHPLHQAPQNPLHQAQQPPPQQVPQQPAAQQVPQLQAPHQIPNQPHLNVPQNLPNPVPQQPPHQVPQQHLPQQIPQHLQLPVPQHHP